MARFEAIAERAGTTIEGSFRDFIGRADLSVRLTEAGLTAEEVERLQAKLGQSSDGIS